jgi:hypothetical protein
MEVHRIEYDGFGHCPNVARSLAALARPMFTLMS